MLRILFAFILWAAPSFALADVAFVNLTDSDLEKVIKEFGATFAHTSVSPASSLGAVFGFELGVIAGAAKTPGIEDLVHAAEPTSDVPNMPHAGLFGAVSVPMGVKFEFIFLPKKNIKEVNLKYHSLAVQWTMTDVLFKLPLEMDLALKAYRTTANIAYTQDVLGSPSDVELDDTITGLGLLMSKKITIFEPYFGFGLAKVDGDMSVSNAGLFSSDPLLRSASKKKSGGQVYAGMNLNLIFMRIGLEVGQILDTTKASAKFSFKF